MPGATKNPIMDLVFVQERQTPLAKPAPHAISQNLGGRGHRRNPHLHLSQHRICHTRRRIPRRHWPAIQRLRLEQIAIADTSEASSLDTPITLGEFIVHQQNLINYTNRLVHASQNQQRDEINNTFIRLVGELETQRQQDLLRIDRGLQILYNTQETRYDHILRQMPIKRVPANQPY